MPLIPMTLAKDIHAAYLDTKELKSVSVFAKKRANAIHDFLKSAIPMTQITFSNPSSGEGIGGLDKPVPGKGLSAALSSFESEILAVWSHGGSVSSPSVISQKEALAIFNFMSQAKVMTKDLGPLSPETMSGPSTGEGGIESDKPGPGLSSAKPILEKELKRIWLQVGTEVSAKKLAKEYAKAIMEFCKAAQIKTTGVISGGTGSSVSGILS
jgi:hypothetical protein